jgi:hypothetical protein
MHRGLVDDRRYQARLCADCLDIVSDRPACGVVSAWDRAAARRAGRSERTAPPRRRSFEASKSLARETSKFHPGGKRQQQRRLPAQAGARWAVSSPLIR